MIVAKFFLKKGRFLANETTRFSSRELTKLIFFYFGHNPGAENEKSTLGITKKCLTLYQAQKMESLRWPTLIAWIFTLQSKKCQNIHVRYVLHILSCQQILTHCCYITDAQSVKGNSTHRLQRKTLSKVCEKVEQHSYQDMNFTFIRVGKH